MKTLILSALLTLPLAAMANSELDSSDVVAGHLENAAPEPGPLTVIIEFNSDGDPIAIAHSDLERIAAKDLENLKFAQITAAAEDSTDLTEATPANELSTSQGTPQWGFKRMVRCPQGGVIAGERVRIHRTHHLRRTHRVPRYVRGGYYPRYAQPQYVRPAPPLEADGWTPYTGCRPTRCLAPHYYYSGQDYKPAGWMDGSQWGGEAYSAGGPNYGYYTSGDRWNAGRY